MTTKEIIAANRASALEQQAQDERNAEAKADMQADQLVNGHRPKRPQYYRENQPGQEMSEVERSNIYAVEVESHRYDEQNH